jgi:hypothetical protein
VTHDLLIIGFLKLRLSGVVNENEGFKQQTCHIAGHSNILRICKAPRALNYQQSLRLFSSNGMFGGKKTTPDAFLSILLLRFAQKDTIEIEKAFSRTISFGDGLLIRAGRRSRSAR